MAACASAVSAAVTVAETTDSIKNDIARNMDAPPGFVPIAGPGRRTFKIIRGPRQGKPVGAARHPQENKKKPLWTGLPCGMVKDLGPVPRGNRPSWKQSFVETVKELLAMPHQASRRR